MDQENMSQPTPPQPPHPRTYSTRMIILALCALIIVACTAGYLFLLRGTQYHAETQQFIIPIGTTPAEGVDKLKASGFIRSEKVFELVLRLRGGVMRPGGYELSKTMNVWQIAGKFLISSPSVWVIIPEGLRKEEIAAILAKDLGWSDAEKTEWITKDTASNPDYFEGVYFPDTYLIPLAETPADTAKRLQDEFNQQFAPYSAKAAAQNIKWTTLLTLASIVQREAAGANDAPTVSGILWNRLLAGMPLDVDATVQYARGDVGQGFWAPVTPADLKIKSPYNTYLNKGLPPHPIDNPGLVAINAALNPASTTCLYYLHDSSGVIHCSATYAGQQKNIDTYLR